VASARLNPQVVPFSDSTGGHCQVATILSRGLSVFPSVRGVSAVTCSVRSTVAPRTKKSCRAEASVGLCASGRHPTCVVVFVKGVRGFASTLSVNRDESRFPRYRIHHMISDPSERNVSSGLSTAHDRECQRKKQHSAGDQSVTESRRMMATQGTT
jgi:transposase